MIIYGWNSKLLKHAPLQNVPCESCKEETTQIGIQSHYVHIFWIPIFPYSKKASIVCTGCQHVTREKEMAPEFKAKVKTLKAAVPFPKYHFAGLGIIAALAIFFSFQSYDNDQKQQNYLQSPLSGDVYILKDDKEPSEYKFYLLKLLETETDSVFITYNSFGYTAIPKKLDPKDGFYNYTVKIAKSELTAMNESGALKKIERGYSTDKGFDRVVEYVEEAPVEESPVLTEGK